MWFVTGCQGPAEAFVMTDTPSMHNKTYSRRSWCLFLWRLVKEALVHLLGHLLHPQASCLSGWFAPRHQPGLRCRSGSNRLRSCSRCRVQGLLQRLADRAYQVALCRPDVVWVAYVCWYTSVTRGHVWQECSKDSVPQMCRYAAHVLAGTGAGHTAYVCDCDIGVHTYCHGSQCLSVC